MGQRIDFFDRKVPLTSKNEVKNIKKIPHIIRGHQRSNWGQRSLWSGTTPVDHSGATPNPNWHFVLELLQKSSVITSNWHFLSLDHLTILFEKIPLPHSLLVPKYQMCQTLSLEVIAFWIFFNYWPYLTLGNLFCKKKKQVHICGPWAISVPLYYICTMSSFWGVAFTS